MPKPDGRIKARELATGAVTSRTFSETIQSDNFKSGVSGWRLQRDTGNLEANTGTFRGDVIVSGGSDIQILSGGDLTINGGDINVLNSAGVRLVGINNQGVKIFDTDGTTEKVALDADGLEVIGGFVTPMLVVRGSDSAFDVTVPASPNFTEFVEVTITPPSWAETVYCLGHAKVTFGSAASGTGGLQFNLNGSAFGTVVSHNTAGVSNSLTAVESFVEDAVSLPTAFTVGAEVAHTAGSTDNSIILGVLAIFGRAES